MQVWCRGFLSTIGAEAIHADVDNVLSTGNLRNGLITADD
jgi:hypothetical protein